jgi:aminopeptidase N
LLDEPLFKRSALTQMQTAKCMTDELGALSALVRREGPEREQALGAFYAKWKHEPLVMNKWLSLQATSPARDTLERVRRLAGDPVFDRTNPNKIYSLFRDFAAGNLVRFHDRDGAGYRFLADQILDIESRNPQVAARLMSAFNQWRRFDSGRQVLMRQEIARVLAKPGLSSDIFEIGSKALA